MADEMQASGVLLPRTNEFGPVGAVPALRGTTSAENDEAPARGVFANLVRGDGDIVGLVAYSIYKQHKLDWLRAFQLAQGRAPNEAELASYLCGEGTPRRLATYRHLANATLAGQGPQVGSLDDAVPAASLEHGRRSTLLERSGLTAGQVAVYALIAAIFIVGVVLALRFTAMPPH